MKVRDLINLLSLADPEAYVVNGVPSMSLMPEFTKARECRALSKTKTLNNEDVRRFSETSEKYANCKVVILR